MENYGVPPLTEKRNPDADSGTQTQTCASTASVISFNDELEGWKSRTDLARRDNPGGCCHVSRRVGQHVSLLCGLARRLSTVPVARLCTVPTTLRLPMKLARVPSIVCSKKPVELISRL